MTNYQFIFIIIIRNTIDFDYLFAKTYERQILSSIFSIDHCLNYFGEVKNLHSIWWAACM